MPQNNGETLILQRSDAWGSRIPLEEISQNKSNPGRKFYFICDRSRFHARVQLFRKQLDRKKNSGLKSVLKFKNSSNQEATLRQQLMEQTELINKLSNIENQFLHSKSLLKIERQVREEAQFCLHKAKEEIEKLKTELNLANQLNKDMFMTNQSWERKEKGLTDEIHKLKTLTTTMKDVIANSIHKEQVVANELEKEKKLKDSYLEILNEYKQKEHATKLRQMRQTNSIKAHERQVEQFRAREKNLCKQLDAFQSKVESLIQEERDNKEKNEAEISEQQKKIDELEASQKSLISELNKLKLSSISKTDAIQQLKLELMEERNKESLLSKRPELSGRRYDLRPRKKKIGSYY